MPKLSLVCAAVVAAMLLVPLHPSRAVEEADGGAAQGVPPPAWPTSPFHGVISGATGEPIPCRCRYRDSDFKLGDTVCMNTHLGVQLARCDLMLNNTSWVPIGVPCTISQLQTRFVGWVQLQR
jgi:hypothetical protein